MATLCCRRPAVFGRSSGPGAYVSAETRAALSRLVCCLVSRTFSPSGCSFSLFGCLQLGLENTTLEGPQSSVPKLRPAMSPLRAEPTAALSWPSPGLTRGPHGPAHGTQQVWSGADTGPHGTAHGAQRGFSEADMGPHSPAHSAQRGCSRADMGPRSPAHGAQRG